MTPRKRSFLRTVAVFLLISLCFSLAACNGTAEGGTSDVPNNHTEGAETNYQIQVLSEGGAPLSGLSVYVYAQESLQDLIAVVSTDGDGNASFTYRSGNGYVAVLGGVPDGYKVESYYPITGVVTQIKLPIILAEGDLSTADYKLGDVMQDFTFTALDGTEYKLSELLKTKKAVVLNFFDLGNNATKMELPYLQEAYLEYTDSAAILGMSPVASDNEAIRAFAADRNITFPMGKADPRWANAMHLMTYPATVVIDRFGMIVLKNEAAFRNATEVKDVLKFFTADDYSQTVVDNYEDLLVSEPEDDIQNPADISGQSSFELTLKPGMIHYLNIHKVSNVWMQINRSDVFVEYGSKTYTASGGSVGLLVSAVSTFEPAQLGFGNSGEETITFTVTLTNLLGTMENPYKLQIGEFTASVGAGNDQGVFFEYTAAEDGYISLQCLGVSPSVNYGFHIMNLTTSVMRVLGEDSETDPATGNQVVRVGMNKGEKVRIGIAAMPDDANNYPAASFKMLAGFTEGEIEDIVVVEKIPYAVTVTDENRQPISGVTVNLTGTTLETPDGSEGETGEGSEAKPYMAILTTGEDGIASGYLPKDTYTGKILIPAGYKATTTTFELSPETPYVSIMLKTYIVETADYTVRVIDEDGAPVPGVLITIGTTFGTTDNDGVFTVNLEKADYEVVLGVPDGYVADEISVPFPKDSTVLGITLKKGSEEDEGVQYTVKVVDATGAGLSDIVVTFNKRGKPFKVVPADANGVAVATMKPGDYTVTLTSSGGANLKYDQSQAVLSAEKTSATLAVAADITSSTYKTAYWGNYYLLPVGSSWDDMTNMLNYAENYRCFMYVFRPEKSGIYRFSVSGGVLGYYGMVEYPFGPSRSTAEDGYFEITVKDSEFDNNNKPSYVIGLQSDAGQTEATITVLRTGDAPTELPSVKYEPTCPITPTLTGSGKVTYVDLTGTAEIEKRADGFYYLNGKKLYMNIGKNAPYVTLGEMVGLVYDAGSGSWGLSSMGTGMKGLVYEGTEVVAIMDFTDVMRQYTEACDPSNGLYPLNDDLIHMVQEHGKYVGWWKIGEPTCLIPNAENINEEIMWMFAVCYLQ